MKVLVTDVKYRMSLAAVRDLGEAGHEVHLLHFGAGEPPAFSSRYSAGNHVLPDCSGGDRAAAIYKCADDTGARVIFPVGAKSLEALAEFPQDGIILPTTNSLRLAGDKSALASLAKRLGVPVPENYNSPKDVQNFPVVLKYRNGEALGLSAAHRYCIIKNRGELIDKYSEMKNRAAAGGQEPPLIQRYIAGNGYGVSAICDKNGVPVSIICHKRLREYPITGGPSTCCEAIWDEALVKYTKLLLSGLNWHGIAMAEFRGSPEGGYYLLEINPRVWGTFPLTRAVHSGFSEKYVRVASGEALPECNAPSYKIGIKMGFRYSNLAAAISYFKHGRIGDAILAAFDAYSIKIIDGVLEKADPESSRAYKKYVIKRKRNDI